MPSIRHRCPKKGCTGRNCTRGSWHWQVRVSGALPVHGFASTKTDADRDASDEESRIRRELREGTYSAAPRVEREKTLGDLIDRYVEDVIPHKDRNKSAHTTIQQLDWWREQGAKRTLQTVTPAWVSEMKLKLLKRGLAKSSVNRYLAALSGAYTGAIRELHWKISNPVRDVSKYSEALSGKKIFSAAVAGERGRYLDPETELPKLLEAAHGELKLWVVLAISCGSRKGSLGSLTWQHVHLEEGGRSWLEFVDPKNGEDYTVDIVDGNLLRPVEMLKVAKENRRNDFVLGNEFPRRRWQAALKAAGIKNFVFHDLRHTAASYASMAGIEGRDLQQRMGWKTAAMATRYVHLSPAHTAQVAQKMAKW